MGLHQFDHICENFSVTLDHLQCLLSFVRNWKLTAAAVNWEYWSLYSIALKDNHSCTPKSLVQFEDQSSISHSRKFNLSMGLHHGDGCEPAMWDAQRSHDGLTSSVSKSVGLLFERDQQTTASGFIIPIRFEHGLYKEVFNKADSSTLDCQIPVLTTTTTPWDQHYLPYLNYNIKDDNTQPHVELSAELQKQPFSRNPLHKTSPCIESRVQLQKQPFSRNSLHGTSPCVESSCVQPQKLQSFSRNSRHETSPCVETSVQLQNQPFSRNSSLETSPLILSKHLPQPRDKHTVQLLPTSQKQDSSSDRFSSGLENLKLLQAKLAHLAYAQGTQDASKTKINKKEQADGGYERIQSAKLVHKEEVPSHSELENQSWSNYHQFPSWKTETDNKPLKLLHLPNSPSWSGYTVRGLNSPPLPPPSQPPLRRHKPSCPSRKTEIATCRMHNPSCPNFQKEVVGPLQLSPGPPPRSHEQLNVTSSSNGPLTNTTQNLPSCRHKPTCIFSQPDQRPQRIHHPNCINAASNAHRS